MVSRPSRAQIVCFASALSILGGMAPATLAQTQAQIAQQEGLYAVANITETQRTVFQKNGQWLADVPSIQQYMGATLPATFDYAVRTTTEAAYSYVIPTTAPNATGLKAYVGGAFLAPDGSQKVTTIICQNQISGQIRPADPRIIRGADPSQPPYALACGDGSIQIPASEVTR
ncbi:type IV pilin-like G/H family protein [Synechococcus sp. PCC 6312]|uniref:type IV pilin-like G/H family protein n=1 Tax=Synechococcus sp. (strain ATCC 27167 / PCC 6312) TaxID=195253 RepID=UPI00029EEC70|nr:type IV pilin-like G/H family protein [Synechococcus sp. PCC 6312]AFY61548.1 hypothetical protein Syn6312_2446 [Synechococcus sp. PCC 6312]